MYDMGRITTYLTKAICNKFSTKSEWVSVKDRLPENGQNVIVTANGEYAISTYNKLFGFVRRENSLGTISEEVSGLIQQIEELRPSYVYGTGEDPLAAEKAKEAFKRIKELCKGILDERES